MCASVRIKIYIILKMNVKGVSIYVCKHNDSMNHSAAVVKLQGQPWFWEKVLGFGFDLSSTLSGETYLTQC